MRGQVALRITVAVYVVISAALRVANAQSSEPCTIRTIAGSGGSGFGGDGGPATAALLQARGRLAVDRAGNLYIPDVVNNRIRRVTPDGIIRTFAGTGTVGFSGDGGPATSADLNSPSAVAVDPAGNVYIADTFNNRIRK